MLEKIEKFYDENILLETISIMIKTTVVVGVFMGILAIVFVVNNRESMHYQPKYAKTQEQIRLERDHEQAVKELFAQ